MTRIYKTVTNPATGRMETVEDTAASSAEAKLKQMRREVREMIEGNVAFHVDPNAAPVQSESFLDAKVEPTGWIEWSGLGVTPTGMVLVRLRSGSESSQPEPANEWDWQHWENGHEYAHIVAYKVVA